MDTKHTPGPWSTDHTYVEHVFDSEGTRVADCETMRGPGVDEANARLIAAAPDMLQALRPLDIVWLDHPVLRDELVVPLSVRGSSFYAEITVGELRAIRDALRKATSPSPRVVPVTAGDTAPLSASPGASGADLCPGCGRPDAEHTS